MRRATGRWLGVVLAAGLTTTVPVAAARTLTFTEQVERLEAGDSNGVAVTARGQIFLAPRLSRLGELGAAGDPVHVWDMVADASGAIFLATGPDGRVLRVSPTGRTTTFFTTEEPMVSALAALPDGDLLVAAAPGGRIYRVDADGNGKPWSETEQRYVWALATATDGVVFAGTGEDGKVLRISKSGEPRVFFDSEDTHIVSLVALPDGDLLAGGAGLGLVYRIDPEGHARVLYDDGLPEVSALALESDGSILAAMVAPAAPESRSPAVRIRLPDGTQVGGDSVAGLDDGDGPMLRGVIEGLPSPEQRPGSATRGQLVRLAPSGAATTLWRSTEEAPFALIASGGRVLFGTGEPARLFRLEPGEDLARLSTLPEAQVTALLGEGRSILVATSNPAGLYRMAGGTADSGTFLSRPFDAGGLARWGSVRWDAVGADAGAEVYTRTGNSAIPDETWSAWSPALTAPTRSPIVNPDGRYLQWRARFAGSHGDTARLSEISVRYAPYNRAPRLREFYLDGPQPAVADSATLRWATYDPDDDPVDLTIEFRRAGGGDWLPITGLRDAAPPAAGSPAVEWREDRVILDTRPMAEGDYELRATVDDQPGNHPGDGVSVTGQGLLRLTVDQTPPEVSVNRTQGGTGYELTVSDRYSDVRALEVREDGRVRFVPRPADGVCDSRSEVFRFELPAARSGVVWSVRAIDTAGNKVEAPLTGP